MLEKLPEAVGEALESVRAGLTATMFHAVDLQQGMGAVVVASLAFADHTPIPTRYTADGIGISPPLHWHGVPAAATEVVLIVEDADSPTPQPWVHALAHGLPPRSTPNADDAAEADADIQPLSTENAVKTGSGALAEGALGGASGSASDGASSGAIGGGDGTRAEPGRPWVPMGRNSMLQARWLPPDPPPGHGVHRYVFQVFALGPGAALPDSPGRDALRHAVLERGLASGCLIGTFERSSGAIDERIRTTAEASDTASLPLGLAPI
jgi:phosphatidylethanolamine-binding protein (PEBP) family uncharacterized protein